MNASGPSTGPAGRPRLPARGRDAHKGSNGTVAVVGGSTGPRSRMIGAPALAGLAALRGGAGLVQLVMPEPILTAGLTVCPGATGVPMPCDPDGFVYPHEAAALVDRVAARASVLAIGPGLGDAPGAQAAVLRAVQNEDIPIIVDADGLNCLGKIPSFTEDFHAAAVLTPHPGEFRRLCEALGLKDHLGLGASREGAAAGLAQRLGCVVVLKGPGTVVSDGQRTWTNPTGHPCLATGGTGDVLTGLIGATVAQFVEPMPVATLPVARPRSASRPLDLFDAARAAVWAHGRAGELWAEGRGASAGLLAAELPDLLPRAVEELRA